MSQLKVSVGPGKPNLKADVLLVQKLLNAAGSALQTEPLKLDGIFGPKTAADILAYQALVLGMRRPNGVVDPGERTIRSLMRGEREGRSVGRAAAVVGLVRGNTQHNTQPNTQTSRPVEVQAFIDFALPASRDVKRHWGVPVALLLAQSGLTTGWGRHVKENAYFGIQGKREAPSSGQIASFEVVEGKRIKLKPTFRAYSDYHDSADDYGKLLAQNPRYRRAFIYQDDPIRFAETISLIWSMDDPQNAELLTRIIRSYGLDEYDR